MLLELAEQDSVDHAGQALLVGGQMIRKRDCMSLEQLAK